MKSLFRLRSSSQEDPPEVASPISLNKLCEAEDFRNLVLLEVMRRVQTDKVQEPGRDWPRGIEWRKDWEVAMAVLAMERRGILRPDAMVLGVGAGVEATTFYLTNFVRWVFATDLYATTPDAWVEDAPNGMLTAPASFSKIGCNPRRLVVQHMDGRDLRFEDNTFDAVYSSSSIEHFGEWEDVAAAAREIGRVLKPGGLLTLSTEYRLRGEGKGIPGVLMFNKDELESLIVKPSGLRWVDQPSFDISALTLEEIVTEQEMTEYYLNKRAGRQASWKTHPHIVLEIGGYRLTSYHLALEKPL
jgi:SAM-dependent methyltransferase